MIFATLLKNTKLKTSAGLAICALLVLLTAACGAKGPLYLPEDEPKQKPAEQKEEQKKKKTDTETQTETETETETESGTQ